MAGVVAGPGWEQGRGGRRRGWCCGPAVWLLCQGRREDRNGPRGRRATSRPRGPVASWPAHLPPRCCTCVQALPASPFRCPRHVQGKSEKDIKNLRQEIEILRQLRHENIIQMLDAFETKTEFCVVTGAWGRACVCVCVVGGWERLDVRTSALPHPATPPRRPVPPRTPHTPLTRNTPTEFAQGELFEILEDDQSLPEDVVRGIAKQLVRGREEELHFPQQQGGMRAGGGAGGGGGGGEGNARGRKKGGGEETFRGGHDESGGWCAMQEIGKGWRAAAAVLNSSPR